jgi:hypothetical protein
MVGWGRLGLDALAGVALVFPFVIFIQHVAARGMGGIEQRIEFGQALISRYSYLKSRSFSAVRLPV